MSAAVVGNGNGPLIPQLLFQPHTGAATVPLQARLLLQSRMSCTTLLDRGRAHAVPISTARATPCVQHVGNSVVNQSLRQAATGPSVLLHKSTILTHL